MKSPRLWLCLSVVLASCGSAFASSERFEDFTAPVLPTGWTHYKGQYSVNGGELLLNSGCIRIGQYSRATQDLTLEARVRIHNDAVGRFNWLVFHNHLGIGEDRNCRNVRRSGIDVEHRPLRTGTEKDFVKGLFNGQTVASQDAASVIPGDTWVTVKARLGADGRIRMYVNDALRLSTTDSTILSGGVYLSSREPVSFDWVRITEGATCEFGPEFPMVATSGQGKPGTMSWLWESCGGPGIMTIVNDRVSSARFTLNGVDYVAPGQINPQIPLIELPVILPEGLNVLEVSVNSRPGSSLEVFFTPQ